MPGPNSGVRSLLCLDREGTEVRRSHATVPSVVSLFCTIFSDFLSSGYGSCEKALPRGALVLAEVRGVLTSAASLCRSQRCSKSGALRCEVCNTSSESDLAAGFLPRISVG